MSFSGYLVYSCLYFFLFLRVLCSCPFVFASWETANFPTASVHHCVGRKSVQLLSFLEMYDCIDENQAN